MASEKFEPTDGEISDVEIRLECLRLATEFSPENERRDPRQRIVLAHSQGIRFVIPQVGTGLQRTIAVAVKPMARSSFGILVRETMLEVEMTPLTQSSQGRCCVILDPLGRLFTVTKPGDVDY